MLFIHQNQKNIWQKNVSPLLSWKQGKDYETMTEVMDERGSGQS